MHDNHCRTAHARPPSNFHETRLAVLVVVRHPARCSSWPLAIPARDAQWSCSTALRLRSSMVLGQTLRGTLTRPLGSAHGPGQRRAWYVLRTTTHRDDDEIPSPDHTTSTKAASVRGPGLLHYWEGRPGVAGHVAKMCFGWSFPLHAKHHSAE